jgi:hypothetical protein
MGLSLCAVPLTASAQLFSVDWYTIDGGGGQSGDGSFELTATVGQPDAGATLSGGGFTLTGGFQLPAAAAVLLGDINLDGVVNLLDVDPFIERISTGDFQAEADCNEDGVVNLLDVDPFIDLLAGG